MNWAKLTAFRHKHSVVFRIGISVLVGLLLEFVALSMSFPALKFTRRSADDLADVMTRMSIQSQAPLISAPRFALINIDDATWVAWGAPLITPRNKIATLLARVAESKPAVIVLDVDLAFRDEENSEKALKCFLLSYPPDAAPLVLVRSFEPAANAIHSKLRPTQYEQQNPTQSEQQNSTQYEQQNSTQYVQQNSTPCADQKKQDVQQKQPANIYWALPSFERDDDGTVRRWQLAAVACNAAAPVTIPSVQLQAAWLWLGKTNELLQNSLARLRPENCDVPVPDFHVKIDMGSEDRNIEINSNDPSSRIIYSIPWTPNAMVQGAQMPDGSFKVSVRNAETVSRIQPGNGIPGIAGTIAIIGGSFHDSGDWYRTPLGQMPGVFVLINSIDALAQHGTPKEPKPWKQLGLSLIFIVFVSLCVGVFRTPVAALFSLVVIAGLMLVTIPMFRSGIILSLAIPSLGILVADFLLSLLHDFDVIKQIGWRWILRPVQDTVKVHEESQ